MPEVDLPQFAVLKVKHEGTKKPVAVVVYIIVVCKMMVL